MNNFKWMARSKVLTALVALLIAAGGLRGTAAAESEKAAAAPAAKSIDVVICLDVSNSMDGLIGSAKTKLWDIVNDLARIQPTPRLRVGLYSYGNDGYDRKVGWIRKEVDLTTDLDEISKALFGLKTRGGTEYVTRICRDAIEQQKWSEEEDALKLIFVCGNEPASQDRIVKLKEAADKARAKGIIINPIFCGNVNHRDARDWKEFATLAGGTFAHIDQDRGTKVVETPMDKELAELSAKLSTTYLGYGKLAKDKAANQAAQDANAAKAGRGQPRHEVLPRLADFIVTRTGTWWTASRLILSSTSRKCPWRTSREEMKKMTPEQRETHVKKMVAERQKHSRRRSLN